MKLNRLLAAGLLAASVVPASASIRSPSFGDGTGGEMFLVVWDGTDQVSYTRDLGILMDDWLAMSGSSLAPILLNDAFFTGFLGVADNSGAADFSDLKFAVIAGDGTGTRRLFTTVDNLVTPYNNGNLTSGTGYIGLYSNNQVVTSANSSHEGPFAVNGQSYDSSPNGAYFLTQNGPTFQNSIVGGTWTNSNFINTESVFRSFTSVGSAGGTQTARVDFAGLWNVSNAGGVWQATYTVTPIPEADGVAMMLAGFGALGFVVRRRRQQR